ncbi:PKD domain-containing protein [Halosolutus gelatinilyticus]|uniref:PKD domain-containing protein n=1 Tax=Halosolutus gelatinilyticus TaxID=2931975 RepID=UPI001FF2310E|nr:PKD domain-containing protein [Halosolutus gelatinilyticus]
MERELLSRRSVLTAATGCALASAGVAMADDQSGDETDGKSADTGDVVRDSFTIRTGTDEETTVYVAEAPTDGPTAVVVGGVHGNEVAGYTAADQIANWTIKAGTLVTIPEANAVAIERRTRTDDDGVDLNRQFTEGSEPETELARAIWNVVADYDPDVLIDLHESTGIYAGDPVDGVGQAIFHSDGDAAADAANAAEYVTRNYVDDPDLAFQTGPFSHPDTDPMGLLVHKAARDLGADAFLAETLSTDIDLETRVQWHSAIVERLLKDDLMLDDQDNGHVPDEPVDEEPENEKPDESADDGPDGDEPTEGGDGDAGDAPNREPPVAKLKTVPEGADERALERGQTVTLDASCSCAPDGEIVAYEWDVDGDGSFDETGKTIEVTIGASGDHTVVLRVTDDAELTDTAEITLSTR